MLRFRLLFAAVTGFGMLGLGSSMRADAQGSLLPLPEEKPIKGMNTPTLSPDGNTICFSYQGDLWTASSSGGVATRLTVHEAHDAYPHYSPDGRWIAFASTRFNGSAMNYDIFLIPSTGGEPRQVTHHTANEYPMDWSPDGSKILFQALRGVETWQMYSVDVKTSVTRQLTNDDMYIRYGVMSPDGSSLAYCRAGGTGTWWRPRYHGSANMEIYSKNLANNKITRVSDYDGTDLWPMYSNDGKNIYYVSDRLTPNAPNLVVSPSTGGKPASVTRHETGAVRWPGIARNGSAIVYEREGDLYTVSTKPNSKPNPLKIYALSDEKQNNLIRLTLTSGATEVEVSPDGKTLGLVVRGEIWTMPTTGGEAKRLTNSSANDYDIIWSPDSSKMVFVSDRNGNFDVFTLDIKTRDVKLLTSDGNDENNPKYSPDGKMVAFLRSGQQGGIYVVPADGSAQAKRITESKGNNLFGIGISDFAWSGNGKWITFSRSDARETNDVFVVAVDSGKETNVTYYPGENDAPSITSDNKFLIFASNRDGGRDLYSVPLQKLKEDGEPAKTEGIDFEDIENRAKRITTQGVAAYSLTPDGKNVIFVSAAGGPPDYFLVPVNGGQVQRLTGTGEGMGTPRFGTDSNRFFALGAGGSIKTIGRLGPMWQTQPIAYTVRMDLNRRAELAQAFNEFWRRYNVAFYDPKMHGVDWKSVKQKYEPMLQGVATREEFALFILSEMVGELNASHTEPSPAPGPTGFDTAELGMSFDEEYAGPGLLLKGYLPKGPNDDLGPKIKIGEYILQIDGEDVSWNESLWKVLADKAGKTVEFLVNTKPTKEGARVVKIKPIGNGALRDLMYENKVRVAREKVTAASNGQLAYIHIRNMDQPSLKRFEREVWGAARERKGLVLDVRNNGGGNTHDQILGQLSRAAYGYTQPRDGLKSTQPFKHWDTPIVLLINQNSASDAEIFPGGFRTLKLGKIVGVPTPGYVIGTYSGRLIEGTGYRIPMWGWFYSDGKNMENNGVRPDILVEHTPDDIAAQRDRQLEVAIDLLMREIPRK